MRHDPSRRKVQFFGRVFNSGSAPTFQCLPGQGGRQEQVGVMTRRQGRVGRLWEEVDATGGRGR